MLKCLFVCRYFFIIFNKSGGNEKVRKYGDWFFYNGSFRVRIFKRDNIKVIDFKFMMSLMRLDMFSFRIK